MSAQFAVNHAAFVESSSVCIQRASALHYDDQFAISSLHTRIMRLLFTHNSSYFPSYGGANKSDRLMMTALGLRGYSCRVIARIDDQTSSGHDAYLQSLEQRAIVPEVVRADVLKFSLDSVEVHVVTGARIRAYIREQIQNFKPNVVIVSTDPLNTIIGDVIRQKARAVYLARTAMLLPFGPQAAFPSKMRTDFIRKAGAVVAVSRYLADYVREHSGIDALHLPIQMIDADDWPSLGNFDNPFITMVNPCALKGIAIFLGLADLFPKSTFAAVPTWGTTSADRAELLSRPNVRLLDQVDDIRDIFRKTRVTLVPSLWSEARGRVVVESMLSGVPVLASDLGGIREAALGIGGLVPVNPIIKYECRVDERLIRVPDVPPQNLKPWKDALDHLITNRHHYLNTSRKSREAAKAYAAGLDIISFESLIREVAER
jgi:glycosyltransferase involved in cell wall biosynthesis